MGRLYYEKKNGPYAKAIDGNQQNFNTYLEKVSKLIPSEIIAGYLTMIGFVESIKILDKGVVAWVIFAAGLILTPFYLNNVAEADKPKKNHLILSTVAFLVWAYVTTGAILFSTTGIYDSAIASITLVLFSLISGLIPLDK